MTLIKYGLNQVQLAENLFSSRGSYWSIDQKEWMQLPWILSMTVSKIYTPQLDEKTQKILQAHLDNNGPEPFLALRHLHRARKASPPVALFKR